MEIFKTVFMLFNINFFGEARRKMKRKIMGILISMLLILTACAGMTSAKTITMKTKTIVIEDDVFHLIDVNSEPGSFAFTCDAHGPYSGYVGEPIQFTGSASGGEPPYIYFWEFGDGQVAEEQNPVHVYEVEGQYPVFLHCYDSSIPEQYAFDETWAYITEEPEDDVSPIVTITFPIDGNQYFDDPEMLVQGQALDNVGVTVLGGQHWYDGGYEETGDNVLPEPYTYIKFDWPITLRPGQNKIRFYAKDAANNYGYDEVTVEYTDDYITVEELVKELDQVMELLESYNSELNNIMNKVTDTDSDGYPDDVDVDSDGDGTPDHQDEDPDDPSKSRDTDGDGKDDSVDPDDDNDGIPDAQDDDDDGDGNSDEDEKILNDNLQKLKAMRDPAVNAAISAAESISPGTDLFTSTTLAAGTMGVTEYSGNKPNIQGQISIDLNQHKKPDGSIDEDEKLDTMLHEMRHCYQTWLIQQTEVTLGVDLDGDGQLENDVTNDADDDWLPKHVPPGMDDEGDLQDDDDTSEKPWDPDNDGDWNDDDAYGKRDKDARDFASKKLKKFKDAKWNWLLEWLKDLISELNSAIALLNSIISELDNISNKLGFLGMTDEQEDIDKAKGELENDRDGLQGLVGTLSGYLPPGESNIGYPEWWTHRNEVIQTIQTTLSHSNSLLDLSEDIISDNGYLPDLDVTDIGTFSWTKLAPGKTVTSSFKVKNIGDDYSQLDWEVSEQPTWGTWTFEPEEGENLGNKDGSRTIKVTITAPNEENGEFSGQIKIVNKDDPNDYETIQISLTTPKNKNINRFPLIQRFQENHPRIITLLIQMLQLLQQ
jgi:heat shock protein beta